MPPPRELEGLPVPPEEEVNVAPEAGEDVEERVRV